MFSDQEAENTRILADEQKSLELQIKQALESEKLNTTSRVDNEHLFSTIKEGQGLTVTGYKGFNEDILIIPPTIRGINVIKISNQAFQNSSCRQVFIPDTVIVVGEYAFSDCKKLERVTIGSGVIYIGNNAFSDCESLKTINLPSSLVTLGKRCFAHTGIEKIVIPQKVKEISSCCFWGCEKLTKVLISEGVTSISTYAFNYCDNLNELIVPIGMSSVDPKVVDTSSRNSRCKLVFLDNNTQWSNSLFPRNPVYTVYCSSESKALQRARQHKCDVRPLSEFLKDR